VRRRELVPLLVGATTVPPVVVAQQKTMPVIGHLGCNYDLQSD